MVTGRQHASSEPPTPWRDLPPSLSSLRKIDVTRHILLDIFSVVAIQLESNSLPVVIVITLVFRSNCWLLFLVKSFDEVWI